MNKDIKNIVIGLLTTTSLASGFMNYRQHQKNAEQTQTITELSKDNEELKNTNDFWGERDDRRDSLLSLNEAFRYVPVPLKDHKIGYLRFYSHDPDKATLFTMQKDSLLSAEIYKRDPSKNQFVSQGVDIYNPRTDVGLLSVEYGYAMDIQAGMKSVDKLFQIDNNSAREKAADKYIAFKQQEIASAAQKKKEAELEHQKARSLPKDEIVNKVEKPDQGFVRQAPTPVRIPRPYIQIRPGLWTH